MSAPRLQTGGEHQTSTASLYFFRRVTSFIMLKIMSPLGVVQQGEKILTNKQTLSSECPISISSLQPGQLAAVADTVGKPQPAQSQPSSTQLTGGAGAHSEGSDFERREQKDSRDGARSTHHILSEVTAILHCGGTHRSTLQGSMAEDITAVTTSAGAANHPPSPATEGRVGPAAASCSSSPASCCTWRWR